MMSEKRLYPSTSALLANLDRFGGDIERIIHIGIQKSYNKNFPVRGKVYSIRIWMGNQPFFKNIDPYNLCFYASSETFH